MKKQGLLFLFLIILLNACQKETPAEHTPEDIPKEIMQKEMLDLVNNYRQKGCNCGSEYFPPTTPVVWNNLLASAAQMHSDDMSKNNFLNHTGSDGKSAAYRISKVGYVWRAYGENIASGYKTANDVMTGWLKSEGHCKNIMNPGFKEMGVATSGNYWTQVFGSR
ncbi:MAG: CAP domain-containing protein [Bacteroidia bacterium]|nr:CAP domain-containing protein [Bacteroidia bacterium]